MKRPLLYRVFGKNIIWMLLALISIPILSVMGQTTPALAVDPQTVSADPGDLFTIEVNVTDVVDLFGYEFKLGFDPEVLTAINVTVGDFLPDYYIWKEELNNTGGYVWFSATRGIGATEGVDGSGTLATISYTVDSEGVCLLDLHDTITNDRWATKMTHDVYDGHFATERLPPVASFTYSPSAPVVDSEVIFNASASYDPDGNIVEYEWDFGDGTPIVPLNETTTTHEYGIDETYTVKLKVTDNEGFTDTFTADVTVSKAPIHDISIMQTTADPKTANPGAQVTIKVTVKNKGTFTETFNVTVSYNGVVIETRTDLSLTANALTTPPLEFTWDTAGLSPGSYTVKVEIPSHPEETTTADNTVTLEVTIQEPMDIMLYVVVGVVIIGAAILVVYFGKIRKPKPE